MHSNLVKVETSFVGQREYVVYVTSLHKIKTSHVNVMQELMIISREVAFQLTVGLDAQ